MSSASSSAPPAPLPEQAAARPIAALAWICGALMAALLGFAFHPLFGWIWDRWMVGGSYYSHGPLVPLVTLYLVWRDRKALQAERSEMSWLGFGLFLVGLLGLILSGILIVYFTAAFALILTIWGMCGFMFGGRVMRRLAFPMFVLVFMVPLPLEMIANISFTLKILASELAMRLLSVCGMAAANDGSIIYLGNSMNSTVVVGDACSGLRSLISLIFMGVLFAHLSELTLPRKIALFIASMPIAIVANVVRVFLLCSIAYVWGSQRIEGFVHDASGWLIYVVAFSLLYSTCAILQWRQGGKGGSGPGGGSAARDARDQVVDAGQGTSTAPSATSAPTPAQGRGESAHA